MLRPSSNGAHHSTKLTVERYGSSGLDLSGTDLHVLGPKVFGQDSNSLLFTVGYYHVLVGE